MDGLNKNIILLESAARTADTTSSIVTIINSYYRGCHIIIDVTADPASAGITPTIQGFDTVSGKYYTLLEGNKIQAVGTTVLKVYPGLTAASKTIANDILPSRFRISMEVDDQDSMTYSVSASLVL